MDTSLKTRQFKATRSYSEISVLVHPRDSSTGAYTSLLHPPVYAATEMTKRLFFNFHHSSLI